MLYTDDNRGTRNGVLYQVALREERASVVVSLFQTDGGELAQLELSVENAKQFGRELLAPMATVDAQGRVALRQTGEVIGSI